MTKNMFSLMLFYGGLFLMLVCGGMALAGFKKEGSAAFAGWICHYDSSLPTDIKALEQKSLSYMQYKNWWDARHRSMALAGEKYGDGNYPHKLQAQMNAMSEQLYQERISYLRYVNALILKHDNSCGVKTLKNAFNSLPQLKADFSAIRENSFLTYRIKAVPLTSQGGVSFERHVQNILETSQSYSRQGRS